MEWHERYNKILESPVYLEEEQHVYIHKVTGERYTSVTTVLSLVKNEFPHGVKAAIVKQYQKFIGWLNKRGYDYHTDKEFFLKCIELYVNYKEFRPYTEATWKGKSMKRYKNISAYKTIEDFLDEFLDLEENNVVERKKNVYLNSDGSIMNVDEMQQFWYDITDVANIYGTMVHEIVEQYILLKQTFIHELNIEKVISDRFKHLHLFLNSLDYTHSPHAFAEYYIKMDVESFKSHIIDSFNALGCDLGRVCVPERLMFNEEFKVCGMCDVFIEHSDTHHSIGDHKTNKDFTFASKYGNKLKAPFSHYDECDLILYNLQLSIYSLLYELETGSILESMWISYYSRTTNQFQKIELENLRDDAMKLITLHKNFLDEKIVKYNEKGILNEAPKIYHNHLIFCMEKIIRKHKVEGFYDGMSRTEIKDWFLNYVEAYVKKQENIVIP